MTLQDALAGLLLSLFDRNELRTLASTDLYLGDLSADLPDPTTSPEETAATVVASLVRRNLAGHSFFRTLAALRPSHGRAIRTFEALWASRRVVVLFDPGPAGGPPRSDAALARTLAWGLSERGHRVWSVPPSAALVGCWAEREVHASSDAIVLVLSASAARHPPLKAAARAALARRRAGDPLPVLMVAAMDTTPPDADLLPFMADASLYMADGAPDVLVATLDRDLRHLPPVPSQEVDFDRTVWGRPRMAPLQESNPPGPVLREEAFAMGWRPPEASFAMEILARPPWVEVGGARIQVGVDRAGVTEGVHTGAARHALWTHWLGIREHREAAEAWDAWYQACLTGSDPGPAPDRPTVPLRWASGGVLPLARWRGRTWVPLFFRDIPPYGWVLPLGATDPSDDLQDPGAVAVREALEELMVVAGEPRRGTPLVLRPLLVDVGDGPAATRAGAASALLAAAALRLERDGLALGDGQAARKGGPARSDLWAEPVPTRTDLQVQGPDGVTRWHHDVLVSVGPLDLGIDVVRVLRLHLDDDDTILDGEILVRPDGTRELVRMPTVMVDWTAITRIFAPGGAHTLEWTRATPPSVRAGPLWPGEIHLFPWDVMRRREIALGARIGDESDPRDRARCRTWLEQFGTHFLDADGAPSVASPSDLWVPATARVLAQAVARGVGP